MRSYRAGEILEAAFPYEELELEKVRPVLVISDEGGELLVAKITSKHKGQKWDIEISPDDFNGLSKASVIQIDKCRKIQKAKLSAIIPRGVINPLQMEIVKSRLQDYLTNR